MCQQMVTSKAMHLKAEWLFGKWHFSSQLQPPVAAHSHHCIIAMFEICTAQKCGLRLRWTHYEEHAKVNFYKFITTKKSHLIDTGVFYGEQ